MKKMKKPNRESNRGMIIPVILVVLVFSGFAMNTASAHHLTLKQMIVEYFVPAFIGCSVIALTLGFIFIGVEKRLRKISKDH